MLSKPVWLGYQVREKIRQTGKPVPDHVKTALMMHIEVPFGGKAPRTALAYTARAFVMSLCREFGISTPRREVLDLPIKGSSIHRHWYRHEASGQEFYSVELSNLDPDTSIGNLAQAIMDKEFISGCYSCAFGHALEDDQVCPVCAGDGLRNFIKSKGVDLFRECGWNIFAGIVGPDNAAILDDISKYNKNFFASTIDHGVAEDMLNGRDESKPYLSEEAERVLYKDDESEDDAEDEDEDEDDVEEKD
jgi:hypothetical protein